MKTDGEVFEDLAQEMEQLDYLLIGLALFIDSPEFGQLGEEDRSDLLQQLVYMRGYHDVLLRRLGRYGGMKS